MKSIKDQLGEFIETADYAIQLLKRVEDGKSVRNLDEALVGFNVRRDSLLEAIDKLFARDTQTRNEEIDALVLTLNEMAATDKLSVSYAGRTTAELAQDLRRVARLLATYRDERSQQREWIPNDGEEPVVMLEVKLRNGTVENRRLEEIDWSRSDEEPDTDIVGYRMLSPHLTDAEGFRDTFVEGFFRGRGLDDGDSDEEALAAWNKSQTRAVVAAL